MPGHPDLTATHRLENWVYADATARENGLYVVNASGAPTRATDADSAAELFQGWQVFVREGTINANRVYLHTTPAPITLGSTDLTFAQLGGGGLSEVLANTVTLTPPDLENLHT